MSAIIYKKHMSINHQNAKSDGSNIVNLDTIRGCKNDCESCFAKKNSRKGEKFNIPVPVESFKGKIKEDFTYRFGNFGDPATDWKHSQDVIRQFEFKDFFVVTKLQSIQGFDGSIKKLQISIDPLNKEHLLITIDNMAIIKEKYPDVKMVARIRSVSSNDEKIKELQKFSILFCNDKNIPVLETRVRFTNHKKAIDTYSLKKENYSLRKGYFKPNKGVIFLEKVKKHHVCDLNEEKCKGCNNCIKLFKE